jgi:hypothetical protein
MLRHYKKNNSANAHNWRINTHFTLFNEDLSSDLYIQFARRIMGSPDLIFHTRFGINRGLQ